MRYPAYATDPKAEIAYVQRRLKDADLVLGYVPLHRRELVVQAGAHAGFWPARLAHGFHKVLALEPEPEMFACAKENVEELTPCHDRITLVNAALSNVDGRGRLQRRDSPGTNHLSDDGDVEVCMVTIDSLLDGRGVDAIILDVEGHEQQVLRGAVKTIIKWCPVIQVELLPRSCDGIHNLLTQFSYRQRLKAHNDAVYTR